MKTRTLIALTVVLGTSPLLAPRAIFAQEPEKLSQQNAIAGTMDIDFKSRKNLDEKGKPVKGAADHYAVTLNVAQTTEFKGTIQRLPLIGGLLGAAQKGQLTYAIDLSVLNPANLSQKRVVGKWVGTVPISASGEYSIEGASDSAHRMKLSATSSTARTVAPRLVRG